MLVICRRTSTLISVQETKARLRRKISREFQVHLKLSQTAAVLNCARKQSVFVIYLFFSYIGMLLLTIKKRIQSTNLTRNHVLDRSGFLNVKTNFFFQFLKFFAYDRGENKSGLSFFLATICHSAGRKTVLEKLSLKPLGKLLKAIFNP